MRYKNVPFYRPNRVFVSGGEVYFVDNHCVREELSNLKHLHVSKIGEELIGKETMGFGSVPTSPSIIMDEVLARIMLSWRMPLLSMSRDC